MAVPTGEDVRSRVAEVLGVDPSSVRPGTALGDLVSDSYRLVEMAIELQDDYDVIFSQADLNGVTSVGDLAELIRARSTHDG
ncbi:MAG: phosphopantetheine-binding protein [Actinomycetota bacterium]|nr:phosphopantetheine-binding protein [Actinomycetota bacterium]